MRRPASVVLVLVAAAASAGAPSAPAAPGEPVPVRVHVRPAVAGVPLLLHGRRHETDARGVALVPATARERADGGRLLRARLRVAPARIGPALRVRFSRWVGRTATVVLLHPVRPVLVAGSGEPVEKGVAPEIVVRGTDGSRPVLRSGEVSWLASVRAVRRPLGGWIRREVSYSVQEVRAHGTNVVHRNQQRFVPARRRRITVRALFFSARFAVRDGILGAPVGRAIVLRFPDGHSERHALDGDGRVVVDGLPRGDYLVTVDAPGMAFGRPVALSRSQDVDVRVITWLDVGLVGSALVVLAIGLALVNRRPWRRAPRARRSAVAGGGSSG